MTSKQKMAQRKIKLTDQELDALMPGRQKVLADTRSKDQLIKAVHSDRKKMNRRAGLGTAASATGMAATIASLFPKSPAAQAMLLGGGLTASLGGIALRSNARKKAKDLSVSKRALLRKIKAERGQAKTASPAGQTTKPKTAPPTGQTTKAKPSLPPITLPAGHTEDPRTVKTHDPKGKPLFHPGGNVILRHQRRRIKEKAMADVSNPGQGILKRTKRSIHHYIESPPPADTPSPKATSMPVKTGSIDFSVGLRVASDTLYTTFMDKTASNPMLLARLGKLLSGAATKVSPHVAKAYQATKSGGKALAEGIESGARMGRDKLMTTFPKQGEQFAALLKKNPELAKTLGAAKENWKPLAGGFAAGGLLTSGD